MKIVTETYKCDRCAKEFKPSLLKPLNVLYVQRRACRCISFNPVYKDKSEWGMRREFELCRECAESLTEWYKSGLAEGGKSI